MINYVQSFIHDPLTTMSTDHEQIIVWNLSSKFLILGVLEKIKVDIYDSFTQFMKL